MRQFPIEFAKRVQAVATAPITVFPLPCDKAPVPCCDDGSGPCDDLSNTQFPKQIAMRVAEVHSAPISVFHDARLPAK